MLNTIMLYCTKKIIDECKERALDRIKVKAIITKKGVVQSEIFISFTI